MPENLIVIIEDGEHAGTWGPFTDDFDARMFAMNRTYGAWRVEPLRSPDDAT